MFNKLCFIKLELKYNEFMNSVKDNKTKITWLIYSITGLLLLGLGLSLLGEAIIFKMEKDIKWFYWGTLSLVVFNSGICFVAEAIIIKIKMQR